MQNDIDKIKHTCIISLSEGLNDKNIRKLVTEQKWNKLIRKFERY